MLNVDACRCMHLDAWMPLFSCGLAPVHVKWCTIHQAWQAMIYIPLTHDTPHIQYASMSTEHSGVPWFQCNHTIPLHQGAHAHRLGKVPATTKRFAQHECRTLRVAVTQFMLSPIFNCTQHRATRICSSSKVQEQNRGSHDALQHIEQRVQWWPQPIPLSTHIAIVGISCELQQSPICGCT